MRKVSFFSSSTASRTVAKLSSTYCVQMLMPITGRVSPGRSYTDSGRNSSPATSFLVHAVARTYIIARGNDAAVL